MENKQVAPQEEVKAVTGDQSLDAVIQEVADGTKAHEEENAFKEKFSRNINIIRKNLKAKYSMNELSRQAAYAIVENNYLKEVVKAQEEEIKGLRVLNKKGISADATTQPVATTETPKAE